MNTRNGSRKFDWRQVFCLGLLFGITSSLSAQLTAPFNGSEWISAAPEKDSSGGQCPVFTRRFIVSGKIEKAVLYITAHGVYEARINDRRVGGEYFAPGYTPYDKRLLYQTYQVDSLLRQSDEIRVTVGDGWYRGLYGTAHRKNNYGKDASLLCKLLITYKDGSKDSIVSDASWQCGTGSILRSNLYFGELQDENLALHGLEPVRIGLATQVNLQPQQHEPVTRREEFPIKEFMVSRAGEQILDFGQGIAGWVQLQVKGRRGDTIRVTHGEWLDAEGNLFLKTLRNIDATDIYVLNGKTTEVLEPHFTYHGFRYVWLRWTRAGKQLDPRKNGLEAKAVALYSNLPCVGNFSCNDPRLNQLESNILWGIHANYFDIPTDCADRGERMGWTGDAEVVFSTVAANFNCQRFFEKWLTDLALEQGVTGAVPRVVPDIYQPLNRAIKRNTAAWGDAAIIIPMKMYAVYGDTNILRQQYPSMKAWVRYELSRTDPVTRLWADFGFGDWLAMGPKTDSVFINQCYMIHSIELFLEAAAIINVQDSELPAFRQALDQCREAFQREFVGKDGLLKEETQTAYLLALDFYLLPENKEKEAAARLVQLIHSNKDYMATGFLGSPLLLPVLSKFGYSELAYKLLENEGIPSWLYPVKMGATTCWEYWDAVHPDGSIDTSYSSPSLDQVAYVTVGEWFYSHIGGIQPLEPGYKKIKIAPETGGGLTWSKCSYNCKYGRIVSDWKIVGDSILMHVEVPGETTAIVVVPGESPLPVGAGTYDFTGKVSLLKVVNPK